MKTFYMEEREVWVSVGRLDGVPIMAESRTRMEATCEWLRLAVQQAEADVEFLQATIKPDLRSV